MKEKICNSPINNSGKSWSNLPFKTYGYDQLITHLDSVLANVEPVDKIPSLTDTDKKNIDTILAAINIARKEMVNKKFDYRKED